MHRPPRGDRIGPILAVALAALVGLAGPAGADYVITTINLGPGTGGRIRGFIRHAGGGAPDVVNQGNSFDTEILALNAGGAAAGTDLTSSGAVRGFIRFPGPPATFAAVTQGVQDTVAAINDSGV